MGLFASLTNGLNNMVSKVGKTAETMADGQAEKLISENNGPLLDPAVDKFASSQTSDIVKTDSETISNTSNSEYDSKRRNEYDTADFVSDQYDFKERLNSYTKSGNVSGMIRCMFEPMGRVASGVGFAVVAPVAGWNNIKVEKGGNAYQEFMTDYAAAQDHMREAEALGVKADFGQALQANLNSAGQTYNGRQTYDDITENSGVVNTRNILDRDGSLKTHLSYDYDSNTENSNPEHSQIEHLSSEQMYPRHSSHPYHSHTGSGRFDFLPDNYSHSSDQASSNQNDNGPDID